MSSRSPTDMMEKLCTGQREPANILLIFKSQISKSEREKNAFEHRNVNFHFNYLAPPKKLVIYKIISNSQATFWTR
jgi:hypothetical protein